MESKPHQLEGYDTSNSDARLNRCEPLAWFAKFYNGPFHHSQYPLRGK
jgi:hypothetical protein